MEFEDKNAVKYQLNDDLTACVISSKATGSILIPRFINYKNKNYKIISVKRNAFYENELESVTFPPDSEIIKFEDNAFHSTTIKKLQIPASLKTIEGGCFFQSIGLNDIEISPNNKYFSYLNNRYLVYKIDESEKEYDNLVYARSDLKETVIPSQIKIIKRYSFFQCKQLKTVKFETNSKIETIEGYSFNDSIEHFEIPASLKEINPTNVVKFRNLKDLVVSPKNKTFSYAENNFLYKTSKEGSGIFDELIFCKQISNEIKIPRFVKTIGPYAFYEKEIQSLTFESNSSLENIEDSAFYHSSISGDIVIPETVKNVGDSAFCSTSINSIQFLGEEITFGCHCFQFCSNLKVISFPNAKIIRLSGKYEQATKIEVRKDAKLIGKDLDNYKNQIVFISDKPKSPQKVIKNKPKKIKPSIKYLKNDEGDKKQTKDKTSTETITISKDQYESLVKHVSFLENHLDKYESIKHFDFEHFEVSEHEDYEDIEYKEKDKSTNQNDSIFIGEEEEKYQENLGEIGEGATSISYKILDKRRSEIICKKVLKKTDDDNIFKKVRNCLKEFEVLHNLDHPCICRSLGINTQERMNKTKANKNKKGRIEFEGSDSDDNEYDSENDDENAEMTTIAIFIEYLEYKLSECLSKNILSNTMKVKIALEVASGMSYLHKQGMIHRDLKIDNIMLNGIYESKIIDFDLVHVSFDNGNSVTLSKGVGTLAYMSPEMQNEDDYDEKTDVYSFGVVLHVLFTGQLPKQKLGDKIKNISPRWPRPSPSISKNCIELIKMCMSFKASDRPSFEEIIDYMKNHSFQMASEVDSKIIFRRYQSLIRFNSMGKNPKKK